MIPAVGLPAIRRDDKSIVVVSAKGYATSQAITQADMKTILGKMVRS
jgi:hypothetical protein